MHKRMVGVFCVILLLMTTLIYRIYYINMADYISAAANVQGRYHLKIASTRGMIYDRNMEPLVNRESRYIASVMPSPEAAAALLEQTEEEERAALADRISAGLPFALEVADGGLYAKGVDVFRVPERYGQQAYAPHLIGYLNGDSQSGAAGIERAYDSWLARHGQEISMRYQVDAAGHVLQGANPGVERDNSDGSGGVVLSLDSRIQLLAQNALLSSGEKGAVVVLDVFTGDILAMASLPAYDQNNIAASLDSEDSPFINRAISGYNIGSVFKVLVAAAALENGIPTSYTHDCQGYIDVNGQIFRCNYNAVHGEVDMARAMQVSCNAYFISLAQELEPYYLVSLVENMGLGTATTLAPGMETQSGNLPTPQELSNQAAYANFSFGQGSSLATPLQIAQVIAAIANTGYSVTPRLVQGLTEDGQDLSEKMPIYSSNRVLSERTANLVKELMVGVVEEGSGRTAKPLAGGAGGKTSSAQTGLYNGEEEIVHAWFAGFYPADAPRYSIAVFVEGGVSGERVAAPIFKQVADGINGLTRKVTQEEVEQEPREPQPEPEPKQVEDEPAPQDNGGDEDEAEQEEPAPAMEAWAVAPPEEPPGDEEGPPDLEKDWEDSLG